MQSQNSQDKALTALVRSMKRSLKNEHGIDVPHAALRAAYLQAQGENPHAFAGKHVPDPKLADLKALVAEAPVYFHPEYDWEGRKFAWLKRAGLVPTDTVQDPELNGPDVRRLYLAHDDIGMLIRLSLDSEGEVLVPDDWVFDTKARLLQLRAEVPKVKRYGLPDYIANPSGFFQSHFQLKLGDGYRSSYEDLGDDSGDSAWVDVHIDDKQWSKLLRAVLADNKVIEDSVAEWVGLHYGRAFSTESSAKKTEWLERYLEAHESAQVDAVRDVSFEFVTPDEDGDSVPATLDLESGEVTLLKEVPDYVTDSSVRTRIWTEPNNEGTDYAVTYRAGGKQSGWHLSSRDLKALCHEVRYMPRP